MPRLNRPRSIAEEHVVGNVVVAMLSLTAIVKPDSGRPFLEDVGLGETLTNAFTLGFFSDMTSRCSHRVEMVRERRDLEMHLVTLTFIISNESATKRSEEARVTEL